MGQEEQLLQRGTFNQLWRELDAGRVTCESLIECALERVASLNHTGPRLNALISLSSSVLDEARLLDRGRRESFHLPLYGIPVVVKDNIDVAGMPSTGGSNALRDRRPTVDAAAVSRLRRAGALVLGKANLSEFARAGTSSSSLGGQALNPEDLSRTPGGSSGGSASSIAAGFALGSLGTDTSQSVRSPASATGLVGMRPTDGLVSRHGVMPVSTTRDAVGPIARTAQDAEALLRVVAAERIDVSGSLDRPERDLPDDAGLRLLAGRTFGAPAEFFGSGEAHGHVEKSFEAGVRRIESLGGKVVPIRLGSLVHDARRVGDLSALEWPSAMDRFLSGTNAGGPTSLRSLLDLGGHDASIEAGIQAAAEGVDGPGTVGYHEVRRLRVGLRKELTKLMVSNDLAGLFYPHQQGLVAKVGQPQLHRNGFLASSVGLPAVCFPGEPQMGVPVGLELMGTPHTDLWLMAAAGVIMRTPEN